MSAVGVKGVTTRSEAERRQKEEGKDDEHKEREEGGGRDCKKGKRETIWLCLLSDPVLSNTSITPPF